MGSLDVLFGHVQSDRRAMGSSETTRGKRLKSDMYMVQYVFIGSSVGEREQQYMELKNWSDEDIETFMTIKKQNISVYNEINHEKIRLKKKIDKLVPYINSLTNETDSRYRGWYFDIEVNQRILQLVDEAVSFVSMIKQEDEGDSRVLLQTFLRQAIHYYNEIVENHAYIGEEIRTANKTPCSGSAEKTMKLAIVGGLKSVRTGTAAALVVEEYIKREKMREKMREERAVAFAMTQHERLGKSSGVPSKMPKELMKRIYQSSLL